jgi:hypothetical protein
MGLVACEVGHDKVLGDLPRRYRRCAYRLKNARNKGQQFLRRHFRHE